MKAAVGDWLLVRSHATGRYARRAEVLAVGADGAPPYTVRWTDTDHETLLFPGPDAEILTAEQLAEQDEAQARRITSVQSAISGSAH